MGRRLFKLACAGSMALQVRLLEADNKTEPEVLERWKGEREKAERESAKANISFVTIREIVKSFKEETEEEDETQTETPRETPP